MLEARHDYLGRLWTERAGILHEHIVWTYYVEDVQKSRHHMWKIWKRPVFGPFQVRFGLPEPNNHHQSTSPSSRITLVNWTVFPSVRKFNSNSFCLFGKSNPTSGSKVTYFRNTVRRAPQAVFVRISVFQKRISVFPTTCEDPAQSVDSKCDIGKWIWRC